jgi:hypothetical protein
VADVPSKNTWIYTIVEPQIFEGLNHLDDGSPQPPNRTREKYDTKYRENPSLASILLTLIRKLLKRIARGWRVR